MNKVRKLAENLVEKYPSLFSSNFEANKLAVSQVMVIRNRALRNQIAGTISVIMRERTLKSGELSTPSVHEESSEESDTGSAPFSGDSVKATFDNPPVSGEKVEQAVQ